MMESDAIQDLIAIIQNDREVSINGNDTVYQKFFDEDLKWLDDHKERYKQSIAISIEEFNKLYAELKTYISSARNIRKATEVDMVFIDNALEKNRDNVNVVNRLTDKSSPFDDEDLPF